MARGSEGFWFDSNNFELIEIYDHESFLQELEKKNQFFSDTMTKAEKSEAKSLGMVRGKKWLPVLREGPGQRRERYLTTAMQRGWVRIRRTPGRRYVVLEAWKLSEDAMASIALALRKMGIPDRESVEIHEVSTNTPTVALAGDLYARLRGEAAGEGEARLGWSFYANPLGRGGAKMRVRGCKRDWVPYPDIGGGFCSGQTGRFEANGPAKVYGGLRRNPAVWSDFVDLRKGEKESEAKIFIGLTRGTGKRRGIPIDPDEIVQFVKRARASQIPERLPGGASFILQRGFFTDWKKKHVHPDEDSLQVLVFPEFDGGETLTSFESNMKELALNLANRFDQESVILNLVVNGELKALGHAHM